MELLRGTRHTYDVGRAVAATPAHGLYLAREVGSGATCLLQIANDRAANGGLARTAYILDVLATASQGYDQQYSQAHGKRLHYDRLFPAKLESFESSQLNKRRVNALMFVDVTSVPDLHPLAKLLYKDRVILDLKTGAWVMGRLLKLLAFTHVQGVEVRAISPNNILLDAEQHFAIVLDWTSALMHQAKVTSAGARHDIECAARTVLASCDLLDNVPYDAGSGEHRYVQLLQGFARGSHDNAVVAHRQFYDLLNEIWPVEFHPFTTLPQPRH